MKTIFAAVGGLALVYAGPALAACKDEVAAAYEKQRNAGSFRMTTNMVGAEGPIEMTVDYVLPNRMHQRVKTLLNQTTVETILVDGKSWTTQGQGWQEASPEFAGEVVKQLNETVLKPPSEMIDYDCLGKVAVDGKEYFAYRAKEDASKRIPGAPQADPPVRLFYVDPATGLPARNVVATEARIDKPFFKTVYEYPQGLAIEPPPSASAAAPAAGPPANP